MLYAIWVVGILVTIWFSVKFVTKLENKGKFDE